MTRGIETKGGRGIAAGLQASSLMESGRRLRTFFTTGDGMQRLRLPVTVLLFAVIALVWWTNRDRLPEELTRMGTLPVEAAEAAPAR